MYGSWAIKGVAVLLLLFFTMLDDRWSDVAYCLANFQQLREGVPVSQPSVNSTEDDPWVEGESCPYCGCEEIIDNEIECDFICTDCGCVQHYLSTDMRRSCTAAQRDALFIDGYSLPRKSAGYKRVNHWNEIIIQLTGRQGTMLPKETVDAVRESLVADGVNLTKVTGPMVRKQLKKMKRGVLYEHSNMMANMISGHTWSIKLAPSEERMLRRMFLKLQRPFEKHKGKRKNFLHYYVSDQFYLNLI